MATKLEGLKAKLEKQIKAQEELAKQIESEELAELQAEEFAEKATGILDAIAAYAKEAFGELRLPSGKKVTIVQTDDGTFNASMLEPKKVVKLDADGKPLPKKVGGKATIEYNGKTTTWADVADELGISYGTGSAHKAVFSQKREVHDTIKHDNCPYV
jgi:hypothetical protein